MVPVSLLGEIDNLQKKLAATMAEPSTEESVEEEALFEQDTPKLGAVHMMYAMEKASPEVHSKITDLLYVDITLNGKKVQTMVDTGATHNFITESEAKRLGLKFVCDGGRMKTFNLAAKPIHDIAKNVGVKLGDWNGRLEFTVATMDDFNLKLRMDFLHTSKVVTTRNNLQWK